MQTRYTDREIFARPSYTLNQLFDEAYTDWQKEEIGRGTAYAIRKLTAQAAPIVRSYLSLPIDSRHHSPPSVDYLAPNASKMRQAWINGVGYDKFPESLGEISVYAPPAYAMPESVRTNAPVEVEVKRGFYDWREDEAYVNFANAALGGGVLGEEKGFVQEEQSIFFQTSLLPCLLDKKHNPIKSIRQNMNLSELPVILRCKHAFVTKEGIYGDAGKQQILSATKIGLYDVLPPWRANSEKKNIFVISMAAVDVKKYERSRENGYAYGKMLRVAIRAFISYGLVRIAVDNKSAGRAPDSITISTGQWGAGAYGNSNYMVFILQVIAAKFASEFLNKKIILKYHDAQLEKHAPKLIEHIQRGIKGKTLKEIVNALVYMDTKGPRDFPDRVFETWHYE